MTLHWIHTSDVHGSLDRLSCIEQQVEELRLQYGDASVMLTDSGDVLQGSPLCYYHNVINPDVPHCVSDVMNRMRYDALAVGNHDIEIGHSAYDRAFREMHFPVLCANLLRENPSESCTNIQENPSESCANLLHDATPYFRPYTILEKCGMRIALLSLLTPSAQHWMPASQYAGMHFADPVACAERYISELQQHEDYDLLVGLFHTGWQETEQIVNRVGRFDVVLYGHDHHEAIHHVGHTLCAAPSSQATSYVHLEINTATKSITPNLVSPISQLSSLTPQLSPLNSHPQTWLHQPLATLTSPLHEFDSYFGPSAYLSVIHRLQLAATGAQVSLAAPLSYDTVIPEGTITNQDIFTLYNRDSLLYTISLTPSELRLVLERSYALWCNTMTSPDDHALLLDYVLDNGTRLGLKHFVINFLSAAGIDYTVDLTKPAGERVQLVNVPESTSPLSVAINSYHFCGGGNILPDALGLTPDALLQRVIKVEPHDLRFCLAEQMLKSGTIDATPLKNWRFVPDLWTVPALKRDRALLTKI